MAFAAPNWVSTDRASRRESLHTVRGRDDAKCVLCRRAAAVENALPYQTQINLALRKYLEGQTLSLSLSDTATIQTLARAIAEEMQNAKPKRK